MPAGSTGSGSRTHSTPTTPRCNRSSRWSSSTARRVSRHPSGAPDTVASIAAALLLAGLALAFFSRIALMRIVIAPLQAALDACMQIAAGDLTTRLTVRRYDEIGRLTDGLSKMQA
jgi:methyl-accepting chemotaxis protein